MNASVLPQPLGPTRVAAVGGAALGPCGVWLYEAGHLDLFGDAYLLNLWVIVALATAGIGIGVYAVVRGARLFGVGSVLLNAGVAALYGFLAVFFGLGGSR